MKFKQIVIGQYEAYDDEVPDGKRLNCEVYGLSEDGKVYVLRHGGVCKPIWEPVLEDN